MKQLYCFLFLIIPFASKSQDNAQTGGPSLPISKNTGLELSDFVWSHSNANKKKDSKPPLNFEALDNWPSISEYLSVCNSGEYFAYGIQRGSNYRVRMDSIIVQSTKNEWRVAFKCLFPGFFSGDNKWYIYNNQCGLCLIRNGSNDIESIGNVESYKTSPDNINVWLAYLLKNDTLCLRNLVTGHEKRVSNVASYDFDNSGRFVYVTFKNDSKELNIYNLYANKEMQFKGVDEYVFPNGAACVVLKKSENLDKGSTKSLQFVNLLNGDTCTIWASSASNTAVSHICIDHSGKKVAFTDNENSIWYWQEGAKEAELKIKNEMPGIPPDMHISGAPSFIENNNDCILFALQTKPESIPRDKGYEVQIDVWNYKDSLLQSHQWEKLNTPNNYTSVFNLQTGAVIQLENETCHLKCIKGDYAVIAKSGNEIYGDRFWEDNYNLDSNWVVNLNDNSRKQLPLTKTTDIYTFSPSGNFLIFNNSIQKCHYFSYELSTGELINISKELPAWKLGFHFELFNRRKIPHSAAGIAGWLEEKQILFVYDDFDIWQLDINGRKPPVNITNGYGARNNITFSLFNNSQPQFNPTRLISFEKDSALLLRAFDRRTKFNGFYSKRINLMGDPVKLFMGPYLFSAPNAAYLDSRDMVPLKAANNNLWIVKRHSATDAPNYFVTEDFISYKRMTNLQPQVNYNWLTSELHSFKQLDGTVGSGVLYKPENFDSTKKYPVIVTFYTHLSDRPFQYPGPGYISRPSIWDDPSWMVSHGYLVFMPDIYFDSDQWGRGVMNSIDGAAKYLSKLPYVDGKSIGAAGHSNSGRFGYYLFTHSKSFAAFAVGGGGGGIDIIKTAFTYDKNSDGKWLEWAESGAVGSGIGNLWKNKAIWVDHMGVMQADKSESPLLCFYNNSDGREFPFEMFTALRRLNKKAWWLQYDKGSHTLGTGPELKDFTLRYTQFFDHYLKGAPAPRWMTQGIPARYKSIESRYELDPLGSCALQGKNKCAICEKWNAQYKRTPEMFEKPISEWHLDEESKTYRSTTSQNTKTVKK